MIRPFVAIFVLAVALIGCSPPPPIAPPPPPTYLHIEPILTVDKNPNTHLATMADGTVMYVQESPAGKDIVYSFTDASSQVPTGLTSRNILAAMGFSTGNGNIQALTECGGNIYFYFNGQAQRTQAICVGKYLPTTGEVKILAAAQALGDLTGAGESLSICHASLATAGNRIWIFIRGLDQSAFLQIDPANDVVRRDFQQLTCDIVPITLSHDAYDIGGAADGSLIITDLYKSVLWRLKPDGTLLLVRNLIGLTSQITTPSTDNHGRIILFISPGVPLIARMDSSDSQRIVAPDLPAMLAIEPNQVTVYAKSNIDSRGIAVDDLQFTQLKPATDHQSWVAYAPTVGQIVRLRVLEIQ